MNESEFAAEWMAGGMWRFGFYRPAIGQVIQKMELSQYPEQYANLIRSGAEGVYLTVNPMASLDYASMIMRIVWDFDSKKGLRAALDNAQLLRETVRARWGVETLLIFTGGRGYHVYAWLMEPYTNADLVKVSKVYGQLFNMSIEGLKLETFDPGLSYPKHQIRAPFTVHQKTKTLCCLVEVVDGVVDNRPLECGFTEYYRSHGIPASVLKEAEQRVNAGYDGGAIPSESRAPGTTKNGDKMRPCLESILVDGPMNDDGWLRTMAVFELRRLGVSKDDVAAMFTDMKNYDKERTQSHLDWVYGREKIYRPECRTIASKGYCIGEGCRLYRWLNAHGKAPELAPAWNRWITPTGGAVT